MTSTLSRETESITGRVGLIGAGGIGRAHADAAAALGSGILSAVADIDRGAAEAVATEHGVDAPAVRELADPDRFDLVVVASPPATHPDLVESLLRAGVPVMCEKPLAVDLAAAQRLADLSAETGTPLTMATKFRFVDDVIQTREMIQSGDLGEILKVEVTFAGRVDMTGRWNSRPEIAGGGVLIDNGTHGVDLVRYLVGEIVEVSAVAGPSGQATEVEDSATLLARTKAGALAEVDLTWSYRRLSPVYCSVLGTEGGVEISWQGARGWTRDTTEPFGFGSGYSKIDSLRDNLAAVLSALAAGSSPPVTTADAVAAAAAIEAGYASLRSGNWIKAVMA
jgi:predicted dehydrogenase